MTPALALAFGFAAGVAVVTTARRVRSDRTFSYRLAREFGRGRTVSGWLQLRFWLTGKTGHYRIYLGGQK